MPRDHLSCFTPTTASWDIEGLYRAEGTLLLEVLRDHQKVSCKTLEFRHRRGCIDHARISICTTWGFLHQGKASEIAPDQNNSVLHWYKWLHGIVLESQVLALGLSWPAPFSAPGPTLHLHEGRFYNPHRNSRSLHSVPEDPVHALWSAPEGRRNVILTQKEEMLRTTSF